MYSYEDRILAVKLYIKLGKRTGATIQQLGYPTRNALKSWYREFEQCCDLPVIYVRSKPKYSDEQKKVWCAIRVSTLGLATWPTWEWWLTLWSDHIDFIVVWASKR